MEIPKKIVPFHVERELPRGVEVEAVKEARRAGRHLAGRLSNQFGLRDCQVRTEFIRRSSAQEPIPPMMRMLGSGGGRGGDVRLKLYLSLLWASPGGEHDTEFEAYSWARLFGLPEPARNGKRRILAALAWLDENKFVSKDRRPGKTTVVTVLHESGSGTVYSKPGARRLSGGEPVYRKLGSSYWTNGWSAAMTGRALAFWLVIMDETRSGEKEGTVWLSESQTEDKYAISPYLRQAALRELQSVGLIDTRRKYVREAFSVKSSRTEMRILGNGLGANPLSAV